MFTGLESPTHILMLLLLCVLFFGAKRLPEIGRSLGTGMREFKDSITGNNDLDDSPGIPPAPVEATTSSQSTRETL